MLASPELRALSVMPWIGALAAMVLVFRQRLQPGPKLTVDFALGLYTVTYFLGVAGLYVGQSELVARYFGGALAVSPHVPWFELLVIASIPYVVLPPVAALVQGLQTASRHNVVRAPSITHVDWAVVLSVAATLVGAGLHVGVLLPDLLDNVFSGLRDVSSQLELYARRQALFDGLSSTQAGMLYGTVPACAALLLFAVRSNRVVIWLCGLPVAGLAFFANAGLFQIAPLLAFGLMLLLCALARFPGRVRWYQLAATAFAGMAIFAAYEAIKQADGAGVAPLTQLWLRLPIAMPFLWEYQWLAGTDFHTTDSVAHGLGEYVFPELAGAERFVAMPQPAFVEAWYRFGPFASLGILILMGVVASVGGRALDRFWSQGDSAYAVCLAVILAPVLYFGFQLSILDLLTSSYGAVWPALPVAGVILIRAISQRLLNVPAPLTQHPP